MRLKCDPTKLRNDSNRAKPHLLLSRWSWFFPTSCTKRTIVPFLRRVFTLSYQILRIRAVVLSYDSSLIRHATIAYLQRVHVEYFGQFRSPGEMLPDKGAELSANVHCHILAKRRV